MKGFSASSFARRIFKSNSQSPKENRENTGSYDAINVILNHDFSEELHLWRTNCCNAFVVPAGSGNYKGTAEDVGCSYAVVTNRTECWQGLEQDITSRISAGCDYTVSACVGVSGTFHGSTDVLATLRLVYQNANTDYLFISKKSVMGEGWHMLEGSFSLSTMPDQVIFYLEGPSPGSDLLIKSVIITSPGCTDYESSRPTSSYTDDEKIIVNANFDYSLNSWSGRGCKVVCHDCMADANINPTSGKYFASATERKQSWNGIQQDITGRVKRKLAYEMTAIVRLYGHNANSADVRGTLWVQAADNREQYIGIAKVQATDKDWVQLQGKFLLNDSPSKAVIFLEGPPPGTDILLNSLVVNHAVKPPPPPPPVVENAVFGVNIITNTHLNNGTNGWFPLGNCRMSVQTGSPHIIPPMARDSLGSHENLSGRYIAVTNRTETWMGPAQVITDKVKLYLTYQVSAWVKVRHASGPQNVSVALGVDDQWVNGGQVEVSDDQWHEIGGSFRIEKQAAKVMVYVQGPTAGIDLMVAGLHIFPVDRHARFNHLKRQTDKIRKRDVILKFSGSDTVHLLGTSVRVRQQQNSFPFGSCICRTNMDNEDFNDFFVKNFNWAVFGNELKWYSTEAQRGKFNYRDADELLDFCTRHNIQVRGHCIFWEVESTVQEWIRSLNNNDLMAALQNRLSGLLTRYRGKFKHYDVNNEMMHGSYYQERLGKDIWANMFKKAHQLDPSAILFVNDYHVEDGCDTRSSPEKYIEHILDLQDQGAPVGGIGIQGHIDCPVGPIVCSALDKLSILGLPIWFTEVDVSSNNEHVRADDLEVILRESFAHPAVEGVVLWGFWELFMSRENAHLVNAEGELNEAGKRYLALKQEWLSHAHGHIDDQGQFRFRGFHGSYEVDFVTASKKITKTFVVDKGDDALVISIDI
ncbi:endo-1,4-beta-xylanase 1-like [Solanum pennellii]|uniref:Endo-1,4-beta-xylanase 1-like n=1 Tax=Solanum pennellii TaxID=28526 RepID=A0ABM1FNF5_SOLPN|nr:endo-1,4-beta-xylanase 1-like [Solanum pennellii]